MRKRIVILALAVVLMLGLLWHGWQQRAQAMQVERQLDEARSRAAKLAADLRQAEKTVVSAMPTMPTMPTVAAGAATSPAEAAAPVVKPATPKKAPGLLDLAHENPELMNQFIDYGRAKYREEYGPLFQKLGLTEPQREKFKDILQAASTRTADIASGKYALGLPDDDLTIKKLQAESAQQTDTEVEVSFGAAALAALKEYMRSITVRGLVDSFAVQIATTSEPLQPAQAEKLAQALATNSRAYAQGGYADTGTLDWAGVDRAAQEFLSPSQWAAWKLGVARTRSGDSRLDAELYKIFEAAVAQSRPAQSAGERKPE